MYKLALFLAVVFTTNTCKKDRVTDCDQPIAYTKESTTLTPNNWQYFSEDALAIESMQPKVYEQTSEGLKIYSDGYRSGARLSSSEKVCLEDRVLYVKWKCEDGYSFNEYCVSLYYDKNGYGGDSKVRTDITRFTTSNSWNNSVVIQPNKWYYTRVKINNGTADAVTAVGDYDTNAGTVIETIQTSLKETTGYLAIRVGDSYGGRNAAIILNNYSVSDR